MILPISSTVGTAYQSIIKPILFLNDAEKVHNFFLKTGQNLGNNELTNNITRQIFRYDNPCLGQTIHNIKFDNPIGLAAGFDYNAQLTQILSSVGFGFATAGTITNMFYEGNPKPRLGRLPKSKSLLVNKGFKSLGADQVISNINNLTFPGPVGISIGRSNSPKLKTLKQSIEDISSAFEKFEKSKIKNAYYEMNISCPNLIHGSKNISFYPPKNLERLLGALDKLKIKKPVFMKMPITETDADTRNMLEVIVKHNISGVIFGNLEKDRKNIMFDQNEIGSAGVGNFSGKPCWMRSNELISMSFKKYGKKLTIVGCGGVFSAEDAYEKIRRGASLVQLITGMVYQGPQLVGKINYGLVELLKRNGFKNIKEAIGDCHC